MKLCHTRAGNVPPNTLIPPTSFIGTTDSGFPIHTAVASWGVNPMNHASPCLSVVPVLPATGRSDSRALVPVPPVTTAWRATISWRADWTDMTRCESVSCS